MGAALGWSQGLCTGDLSLWLELRNGRNGGNGSHAKSTNWTDLRTALLHSQDADAGATTTTKVRSQPLKISSQLEFFTIYRIDSLSHFFLEKEN
jgi:hypothetical protein